MEINLDGFQLGLSPEEIMADLNFGVGPIAEAASFVQEGRRETGSAA